MESRKQTLRQIVLGCVFGLLGPLGLFSSTASPQTYLYNQAQLATGNGPADVIAADFNGDGMLDLAVTNASDDTVSILLATPGGAFAPQVPYATGTTPQLLLAADFNGDGKPDLAVLDVNGNTVSILIGNGDGTFRSHVDYATGSDPIGVVAADFNGDGRTDLAAASGALTIIDNAGGSPQGINLSGIGSATAAVFSLNFLATLDFGPQTVGTSSTLPVTLANAADQPLLVRRLIVAPRIGFSETNNCGTSVAPGASCTINVTFTPKTLGSARGVFIVVDSGRSRPIEVIRLSGNGMASGSSRVQALPKPSKEESRPKPGVA